MNFTIITHTAAESYFDRCGDHHYTDGHFEVYTTTDEHEFIYKWARAQIEQNAAGGDLVVLFNGIQVADLEVQSSEEEVFYRLDDLKSEEVQRQLQEMANAKAAAVAKKEAEAKERARIEAAAEHARKMKQLEALRKELGV